MRPRPISSLTTLYQSILRPPSRSVPICLFGCLELQTIATTKRLCLPQRPAKIISQTLLQFLFCFYFGFFVLFLLWFVSLLILPPPSTDNGRNIKGNKLQPVTFRAGDLQRRCVLHRVCLLHAHPTPTPFLYFLQLRSVLNANALWLAERFKQSNWTTRTARVRTTFQDLASTPIAWITWGWEVEKEMHALAWSHVEND